jgi:hypothetical protein
MEQAMSEVSYQNMQPLYYRLSGKFSFAGLALTLLVGCAAAVPLSFAYAYATIYTPIAGWVTFLLTGGFALGLGVIVGAMLKKTKTRNRGIGLIAALLVITFAYLLTWDIYVYAIVRRSDPDIDLTLWDVIKSPADTWDVIKVINEQGVWTLKKHRPTGIELTILWIIEAAMIYGISLYFSLSALSKVPFCETCHKWGIIKPLINTSAGNDAQVKSELERHNFSVIETLGPPNSIAEFYSISLQGCPDCDTTQTLCVDHTTITTNNKGESSTKNRNVVHRLNLTPEELVQVATHTAAIQIARTTPPPETTEAPPENPPAQTPEQPPASQE